MVGRNTKFLSIINSSCLNVKVLVGAFNQEKVLIRASSVIVKVQLREGSLESKLYLAHHGGGHAAVLEVGDGEGLVGVDGAAARAQHVLIVIEGVDLKQ